MSHWLIFKQNVNFCKKKKKKDSEWCTGENVTNCRPGHYNAPKKVNRSNTIITDTNEVFRSQQNNGSIPAEYFLAIDLFRQPIQYSFLRTNVLVIIETSNVRCLHHRRYVWMMKLTLMGKSYLKINTYTVKQSASAKVW